MCCILTSVQRALSLTRSEFSRSIIMHHENGQVARTQLICFHRFFISTVVSENDRTFTIHGNIYKSGNDRCLTKVADDLLCGGNTNAYMFGVAKRANVLYVLVIRNFN